MIHPVAGKLFAEPSPHHERSAAIVAVMGALIALLTPSAAEGARFVAVGFQGEFSLIDSETHQVSSLGTAPLTAQGLSWSPAGVLYGATRDGGLYTIDTQTWAWSFVMPLPQSDGYVVRSLAFAVDGTLYADFGLPLVGPPHKLRAFDIQNMTSREIGILSGDGTAGQGLEFGPDGRLFGMSNIGGDPARYQLFSIDLDDAETHRIWQVEQPGGGGVDVTQSIAFTPDGSLFGVGFSFAQLNPDTGAVVPGSAINLGATYRALAVVPEPAGLLMLISGFTLLAASRAMLRLPG